MDVGHVSDIGTTKLIRDDRVSAFASDRPEGFYYAFYPTQAMMKQMFPPPEKRIALLVPQKPTRAEWISIKRWMQKGIWNQLNQEVSVIGVMGWSHTDIIGIINEAVINGATNSTLFVMNGDRIGTGLDETWMRNNYPTVEPRTMFITSFRLTHKPVGDPIVITQRFGQNLRDYAQFGLPGHPGVDIGVPEGTPVRAMVGGVVERAGFDPLKGNHIIIRTLHDSLIYDILYAHLKTIGVISNGERVMGGNIIGASGNTGNSSGPHLHVQLNVTGAVEAEHYQDDSGTRWQSIHDITPYLKEIKVGSPYIN